MIIFPNHFAGDKTKGKLIVKFIGLKSNFGESTIAELSENQRTLLAPYSCSNSATPNAGWRPKIAICITIVYPTYV